MLFERLLSVVQEDPSRRLRFRGALCNLHEDVEQFANQRVLALLDLAVRGFHLHRLASQADAADEPVPKRAGHPARHVVVLRQPLSSGYVRADNDSAVVECATVDAQGEVVCSSARQCQKDDPPRHVH